MGSTSTKSGRKLLLIIDGNNYLNRAYHATPKMKSRSGVPTNAVKGFLNILMADLMKLRPSHVVVTFDKGGKPNWRCKIYPPYKQNRRDLFDKKDKKSIERVKSILECRAQHAPLKKLLKAMGIRTVARAGVDADDMMGTLARQYADKGFEVIICSNDKDMCQLVDGNIRVMNAKRVLMGQVEVIREYGVRPSQIVDYLTMMGDSVDNIEGLSGCGAKTAAKLLGEYKSLSNVIKNRDELTPALSAEVKKKRKVMKITRQVVMLNLEERHKVKTSQLVWPNEAYDEKKVKAICDELDLKHTLKHIQSCLAKWTEPAKSAPKRHW